MSGPNVWGPHGWKFIHYITLGYPNNPTEKDKERYYNFFHALKFVIPCSICGAHFRENLEKNPINDEVLSSKEKLINWGIQMHNLVNKKNGKKVYTYEEGLADILKNKESCQIEEKMTNTIVKKSNNNIYLCLSFFLNIALVLFIVIKLSKK
jgi:hypothetical protein